MGKVLKTFVGLWAGATVVILLTTKTTASGLAGFKEIFTSEKLFEVLAEGFYYGALLLAILTIYNRKKERDEAKAKEAPAPAPVQEPPASLGPDSLEQ